MPSKSTSDFKYSALFRVQKQPGKTLRDALYAEVIRLIGMGHFRPGQSMPSSRVLATELQLSRNTVSAAYQDLVLDGVLVAHERSGFRVSDAVDRPVQDAVASVQSTGDTARPHPFRNQFSDAFPGSVVHLPRIYKDPRWRDCRYKFIFGQADISTFPAAHWRQIDRDTNSLAAIEHWTRESYDEDDPNLIEALCDKVLPRRGIWVRPDQVLITSGTQNALYLISRLLVTPGAIAALEDPGYVDVGSILRMAGAHLAFVPVDEQGMMVHKMPPRAQIAYCTPSSQFPTTATMSIDRRNALLDYVAARACFVIEDDYESELPFNAQSQPALRGMTEDEHVIYLSSFSKSLAPGLRIGYIVAAPRIIRELRALRRLILRTPSQNNQAALGAFVQNGFYEVHMQKLRAIYAERYAVLTEALARHAPDLVFSPVSGGSSVWIELPEGVSADRLQRALLEKSVFIENGDVFYAETTSGSRIKLSYSSIVTADIPEGIRRLAKALDEID
ncbi:MAG: PLP-dependent aminotransferase family protein [Pseudomonadota bacterium]|nr:PLP-dependent aminotransferase family protein [Pseudomonadota bacterium]